MQTEQQECAIQSRFIQIAQFWRNQLLVRHPVLRREHRLEAGAVDRVIGPEESNTSIRIGHRQTVEALVVVENHRRQDKKQSHGRGKHRNPQPSQRV